jgi:hypothetical protein
VSVPPNTYWLSTEPTGLSLKGGDHQALIVTTAEMPVGTYTGTVTFGIGSVTKVVQITLVAKPALS